MEVHSPQRPKEGPGHGDRTSGFLLTTVEPNWPSFKLRVVDLLSV